MVYLYIGAGGFLGAISRYAIENLAKTEFATAFPAGTFFVNVAGCFLIGFIMTLSLERMVISPNARMGIVTGYLGGLTTFSTYTYQALTLLERGAWSLAGWYTAISVIACMIAVWLGVVAARMVPILLSKGAARREATAEFKN